MNRSKKYTGLLFFEGRRDCNFIRTLIDLDKFQYHTSKWRFTDSSGSGESPQTLALQCFKISQNLSYDLILCFVDIDKLKQDFREKWEDKKIEIEKQYPNIIFIWQIDNAEDEYKRVLGESNLGKHRLNKYAKEEIAKFINSDFWKRILSTIKKAEENLDSLAE